MYPATDYVFNITANNSGAAFYPFGMNVGPHDADIFATLQGGPAGHSNFDAAVYRNTGQPQQEDQLWFDVPSPGFTLQSNYNATSFDAQFGYQPSIATLLRHLSELYEQHARLNGSSRRASGTVNNISTQRPIVPPLSKPLWPVDDVVQGLNDRIGLAAIQSRISPSPPNSSPVPIVQTQHEILFNGYTGAAVAEANVHPSVESQHVTSGQVGATGRLTSSKPRLVELQQAQTFVHGQSQYTPRYSFQPYRSESGLDQALMEVPSPASTASPRPVATPSSQDSSQDNIQPYRSESGLNMALGEIPSPASTVPSPPAMAPTLPSHLTLTGFTPPSLLAAAPARKRKDSPDEASNMSASAPSSSAPTKKRKLTPSSTRSRQPPVPRYFPSTSSYRRIESRPSATTSEHSEGYQRLPRDPNATAYDMLGIPTSTGRPGSRYGPFAPINREDLMRRS